MTRRPLVGLVLSYMVGTWAGLHTNVPFLALLIPAAVLSLLGILLRRKPIASLYIHTALALTAWMVADVRDDGLSPNYLAKIMGGPAEHVKLIGVVTDDPEKDEWRPGMERLKCSFRVERLKRLTEWQDAVGQVEVVLLGATNMLDVAYGEKWQWSGVLRKKEFFGKQKWVFYPEPDEGRKLSDGHGWSVMTWCLERRKTCAAILDYGLEHFPDQAGILKALLLGYREDVPDRHHELFAATGVLHVMAISGLHVGVFLLLLVGLMKLFGLSRQQWIIPVAPLLFMYVLMTGFKISAFRAGVMAVVFGSAFLCRRKPDGPSSLSAAALLVLLYDPKQLIAPGFIFSFAVVAGLIVFYRPLAKPVMEFFKPDEWTLGPEPAWKRASRTAGLWLAGIMTTSIIAWLVSAPLTANYFNLFSPVALLGNLVVVPGAFVIVLTGCLSLIASCIHPIIIEIFNHANRIFIDVLVNWVELLAQIPGGHEFVRSPGWLWVLVWYVGLFSCVGLTGWMRRASVTLSALALLWGGFFSLTEKKVLVDVLDVGQGNAVLVDLPGAKDMMIDVGPAYYNWQVRNHLRRRGIDRLDTVVLTHADADHIGGILELIKKVPVREVWIPPGLKDVYYYRHHLKEIEAAGIETKIRTRNQQGDWPGDVYWEVLHPSEGKKYKKANDGSLVMRVSREGGSILFMGGGGGKTEQEIMSEPIEPAAMILMLGNHGEPNSSLNEWIDLVGPKQAIISVGRNTEGMPSWKLIDRYETKSIPIWRTDKQGGCRIELLRYTREINPTNHFRMMELKR